MAATSTSWVNYEKIEQEADLIRKKHGFESAPVDPYAVASRLGFRVRIATFKSPDLAGQMSNRSELFVIDVSLNDSSLRQSDSLLLTR